MTENLLKLSEMLNLMGLNSESERVNLIIKNSEAQPSREDWEKVIDSIENPIPAQSIGRAVEYFKTGFSDLAKSTNELKDLPKEDIALAIEVGTKIPGAIKGSSVNIKVINKFSNRFVGMNKKAQMQAIKGLGTKALRIVPWIGAVFSGILAIKNILYGCVEYKRLMSFSSKIELGWQDTLSPAKIAQKINQNRGQPGKLTVAVKTSQSAKIFVDEAISFVANSIDFSKDIAFFLIESVVAAGSTIIPPGWAAALGIGAVDIALSVIIMIIEAQAESSALAEYDKVIQSVKEIALKGIQDKISLLDFNEWSGEDLELFLSRTN